MQVACQSPSYIRDTRIRRFTYMKKKISPQPGGSNLPVSKQTAGGVTGAVIGGAIAGPVGAVIGGVAGTIMGKRAAEGKSLISSSTVKAASKAVEMVKDKLPSFKMGAAPSKSAKPKSSAKGSGTAPKPSAPKAAPVKAAPKKAVAAKPAPKIPAAVKPAPKKRTKRG
jgi:hypothetical protein